MRLRFSRFLLILPLCLFAACAAAPKAKVYHHVSVLNVEGGLIAAWTAEGEVERTADRFYRFDAVEHTLPDPARTYHYPLGWRVSIAGPRVVYYRVDEPAWLHDLTALDVADRAEARGGSEGK